MTARHRDLRSEYFTPEDQLVTLCLSGLYPSADRWEVARREGLWISSEMGSHIDNVADVLADLNAKGLLKSSGAAVNLAPRSDAANAGLSGKVGSLIPARRPTSSS